jgi:hypothetical protein
VISLCRDEFKRRTLQDKPCELPAATLRICASASRVFLAAKHFRQTFTLAQEIHHLGNLDSDG